MKRDKKYRVENLSEPDVENTVESRRDGIARWKYDASPRSSPRLSLTRQGLVRYLAFVVCKLTVERRENMKGDTNVSRWRSSHTRGKGATNEEKFFSTSISASSVLFFFLFFFFFFFSFFFFYDMKGLMKRFFYRNCYSIKRMDGSRSKSCVSIFRFITVWGELRNIRTIRKLNWFYFFFFFIYKFMIGGFIFRKRFLFFWTQFFNPANLKLSKIIDQNFK